MWDLPRPGIEPVPPALADGFFITEPPGKPKITVFCISQCVSEPLTKTMITKLLKSSIKYIVLYKINIIVVL